jgi:hypothetical protein
MADLQRVPVDRPLPRSWLPTLLSALALVIALAVVKPWGDRSGIAPAGTARASPQLSSAEPTRLAPRSEYDPRLFGSREPDPAWELWPAGYVVEFGLAGPLPVHGQDGPSPGTSPKTSAEPKPGASAAPPASPPGPSAGSAINEHVVDLGPTDHLIALGINTPADVRVETIWLWFYTGPDCCLESVAILRLPTSWESRHFSVIAVADPAHPDQPGDWPPGEYRLDLVTIGAEVRSVRLRVSPPVN